MLPALMAAKPLIKYGVMIGVPLLILSYSHTKVYFAGKAAVYEEWDTANAEKAAQNVHEVVKAEAMESKVVKEYDAAERVIQAYAEQVKKEVVDHAKQNKRPLSAAVVTIYDRLISVPNKAGISVPSPDPGTGASEVPRGGVAVETPPRVQVDTNGDTVELTTEELVQAAVDFAEKYALMKNAYKGLSEWNDGREQLELDRLKPD